MALSPLSAVYDFYFSFAIIMSPLTRFFFDASFLAGIFQPSIDGGKIIALKLIHGKTPLGVTER